MHFRPLILKAIFLFCLNGMAVLTHSQQLAEKNAVRDALQPLSAVQLQGYLETKLSAIWQKRIAAQDINRLVQPFLNRTETSCWQTEFWGKWFTAAVLAYRYKPDPLLKKILDSAAAGLMATQTSDGYIGNYAEGSHLQQWDIWGRKYCLLGLIAYYDLTGSRPALETASKLLLHLMGELSAGNTLIVKTGNHRGMAASSVLEPTVLLYTRTGNNLFLGFAREIVREWETADGPGLIAKSALPVGKRFPKPQHSWYGWEQGQKAYEMMSCYEGLLELYRVTGIEAYKTAVENTWESIRHTELNIAGSGAAMECWFGGAAYQWLAIQHYQETCVTVTWIKLCQQLLRLTGKAKYADAIEQTYYNALLGAMYEDGSGWAKYSPLSGERLKGGQQCNMGINCCEASGPRALFTLPFTAIMKSRKGFNINFFVPGSFASATPGKQAVRLVQATSYPVSGRVVITVQLAKPEFFVLQVRHPEWSQQLSITVNGEHINTVADNDGYAGLGRNWKNGDSVVVILDMRGRLHAGGDRGEYFAITRGPLVLARDGRLGPPDTDEPLLPLPAKDGFITLQPEENPDNNHFWLCTSVSCLPESHAEGGTRPIRVPLCDYASAGKTFDDRSRFRVWIYRLLDAPSLP